MGDYSHIKILHSVRDVRQPAVLLLRLWPVHCGVVKISKYLLILSFLEFSLLSWIETDIVSLG